MKKIIIILLTVFVLSFLSGCEKEAVKKDYTHEEHGFTFDIPSNWENKYEVVEDENSVAFFYSECLNEDWDKQMFFAITVMSKADYEKELNDPPMVGLLLGESDGKAYVRYIPLDIGNLDEKQTEEYYKLNLSDDDILRRFHLNK